MDGSISGHLPRYDVVPPIEITPETVRLFFQKNARKICHESFFQDACTIIYPLLIEEGGLGIIGRAIRNHRDVQVLLSAVNAVLLNSLVDKNLYPASQEEVIRGTILGVLTEREIYLYSIANKLKPHKDFNPFAFILYRDMPILISISQDPEFEMMKEEIDSLLRLRREVIANEALPVINPFGRHSRATP